MKVNYINRMAGWILSTIGVYTVVSLLLLAVILGGVVAGLKHVAQIYAGVSLYWITFLGLVTGWFFARTRLSGKAAFGWAVFIGLLVNWLHIGKMGGRLLALLRALDQLLWESLRWRSGDIVPDTSLVILLLRDIWWNTSILLGRFVAWMGSTLTGNSSRDLLASTLLWGSVLWAVSVWAGWSVRRHSTAALAVLPAGALAGFGFSYTRIDTSYLLPILGGAFFLMAWTSINKRQRTWLREGTDYSEDIFIDMVVWTSAFVGGIIVVAFWVSSFSPQSVFRALSQLAPGSDNAFTQLGDSLGLEQQPAAELDSSALAPSELPRDHLLGSGPELNHNIVMVIKTGDEIGAPDLAAGIGAPSYHWRMLTYDVYTGRGWTVSPTENARYRANQILEGESSGVQRLLKQEIQVLGDVGDYVYSAGSLGSVDQRFRGTWRINEGQRLDLFGAVLENPDRVSIYNAESYIVEAGEQQLRASRPSYPLWLYERYVQLPEDTPQAVTELAEKLTEGAETPYDQAKRLERYLRTFPYTLDVPKPPQDQDVASYFLFDLKKGYCDYYATSMVVMARAISLPSRLVIGYATGTYQESIGNYIITEADAHSWVEVYFPEIGWVEFEPTGGRPLIERPDGISAISIDPDISIDVGVGFDIPSWLRWGGWALAVLAAIALAGLLWLVGDLLRIMHLPARDKGIALYARLYRQGHKLAVPLKVGHTPREFANSLAEEVDALGGRQLWSNQRISVGSDIEQVIDLYERAIYNQLPPEEREQTRAIRSWGRLRRRLIMARMTRLRKNIFGKFKHSI